MKKSGIAQEKNKNKKEKKKNKINSYKNISKSKIKKPIKTTLMKNQKLTHRIQQLIQNKTTKDAP